MPLIITIVCMASFLLLVAALYGCCHQRLAQRKDQVRTSLPWPGKQSNSPGDFHPIIPRLEESEWAMDPF